MNYPVYTGTGGLIMKREDIITELQKHDQTILSFPERGPWGDNKYRGNCSGWIQAFLVWKYHVEKFAELFAGSGSGYDVCKDLGISYVGADLNPTPVREGIIQLDAFKDDVPDAFYGSDMIFMHPPYGAEIKIPYAGSMYPDPTGELSKADLGQMPWEQFMKTLNHIIMKYYASLQTGSYMSVLMGDVRRNGFHSMLTDIVKPGEMQQIIIKEQHNYISGSRTYQSRNFVPIVHEYIMVLKKIAPYILSFQLPQKYEIDIRDSKDATWQDVVWAAMKKLGGEATLNSLYSEIEGYKRCDANEHWQEKIRQTLQRSPRFMSTERGHWKLSA